MSKPTFPSSFEYHIALDHKFISEHISEVFDVVAQYDFDTLVGCGFGSIPWVIEMSRLIEVPYVLVRKASDTVNAGRRWPVVGRFGTDRACVFIDDCIASGRTRVHVKHELEQYEADLVTTVQLDKAIPGFYDLAYTLRMKVDPSGVYW